MLGEWKTSPEAANEVEIRRLPGQRSVRPGPSRSEKIATSPRGNKCPASSGGNGPVLGSGSGAAR